MNLHPNNKYYPKEECGIAGIYNISEAATLAYLSIYALQHRGQESAGIASFDSNAMYRHTDMGKVADVFNQEILSKLKGNIAIGHNRYSTTGASFLKNAQPIFARSRFGSLALAHNGNLVNSAEIRNDLENEGAIFQTTVDSEVICHLMARTSKNNFLDVLVYALSKIKGAYSLLILNEEILYAIRDPFGFRPLVLGKKEDGYVLASETCALDIINAEYVREVKPGEILVFKDGTYKSYFPFNKSKNYLCIFEHIYFSRPDSHVFNKSVYESRCELGKQLAEESFTEADIVIPVPDSSNVAALGYAEASKIPFHFGMIRSHYIGRTFIEPEQKIRDFSTKIKYNIISSVVQGKRVIVIDDSIIRGTTSRKIVDMLYNAGAKEIHMKITAPPTKHPCYYGIDIPTQEELIAHNYSIQEIQKKIGVTSLYYLSLEGIKKAIGKTENYCLACFTGDYPIPMDNQKEYINQRLLFRNVDVGR